MLDRYLENIGWKVDGEWDKYEVAVDVAIVEGMMLIVMFVGWIS